VLSVNKLWSCDKNVKEKNNKCTNGKKQETTAVHSVFWPIYEMAFNKELKVTNTNSYGHKSISCYVTVITKRAIC